MSIKQQIPSSLKQMIRNWIVQAVKTPPSRLINASKLKRIVAHKRGPVSIHFGCGPRHLDGWINLDIYPFNPRPDALLDLERPLPLEKETVDYIFTEDLIEHLTYDGACKLLSECARVLKPGGMLRVGTPDLKSFMMAYLNRSQSDLDWYREQCNCSTFAEMFNAGMRAWGHTFIYDEETLTGILEKRGFSVQCKQFNETDATIFKGLDLRNTAEGAHSLFLECTKTPVAATRPQLVGSKAR